MAVSDIRVNFGVSLKEADNDSAFVIKQRITVLAAIGGRSSRAEIEIDLFVIRFACEPLFSLIKLFSGFSDEVEALLRVGYLV